MVSLQCGSFVLPVRRHVYEQVRLQRIAGLYGLTQGGCRGLVASAGVHCGSSHRDVILLVGSQVQLPGWA